MGTLSYHQTGCGPNRIHVWLHNCRAITPVLESDGRQASGCLAETNGIFRPVILFLRFEPPGTNVIDLVSSLTHRAPSVTIALSNPRPIINDMEYSFEWDPAKAGENLRKHRVAFPRAAQVFLDPDAISIYDEEHSIDEERWITLGKDTNDVFLVVVHTFRKIDEENVTIRLISARRATRKEAAEYVR